MNLKTELYSWQANITKMFTSLAENNCDQHAKTRLFSPFDTNPLLSEYY